MVAKPNQVTFLEQIKDPWDVRRMETAIYPGMYLWMKQITQVRGTGLGTKSYFVRWFEKICFSGDDFGLG